MTRVKKNIIVFLFLSLLFLTAGLFVGCGEKTEITSLGQGQVEKKVDKDNNELYTAIPDKWNDFLGWFDGDQLYSTDPTLAIPNGQHKKLQARFGSNGEISTDRALAGLAKTLEGKDKDKYLKIASDFLLTTSSQQQTETYKLSFNASLSVDGEEHIISANLKDGDDNEKLALNLHIGQAESKLYLAVDGEKFAYDLPNRFKNIIPFDQTLTVEDLAGDMYITIASVLGYDNQLGLFESVENTENQTKLTIRVDKILDYMKNIVLPNLAENDVWVKELIETFTKKYQGLGKELPVIRAYLEIDYENDVFKSIDGKLVFEEDYKLELEDTHVISAGTAEFEMLSYDIGYSQNPQEKQDTSSYSEEIYVANMNLQGKINFLQKDLLYNDYTILDSYNISLHSDINVFAFEKAVKNDTIDWDKIDWENFGFLSLRMTLADTIQPANHSGQGNYISLLIDTEKFGANLLVYGGLYNSKMAPVTEEYVINNTFYLPKILSAYGDGITDAFPEKEEVDTEIIINALKGMIGLVIANETYSTNDIIFKFLEGLMSTDEESLQILKDCFKFEEDDNSEKGKIILTVDEIENVIKEGVSNIASWLGYANFTDNMFGTYTSHISFDFEDIVYGKINDEVKTQDLASYNEAHTTIVGVSDKQTIAGIDDQEITADTLTKTLDALVGKEIELTALMSDGKEATTFVDYLGQEVAVKLTVHSYKIISQGEGEAKVEIYFTFTQGTFAKALYTHDIPYGLIALEKTIALV